MIEYRNPDGKVRTFQRDASMLSLLPPSQIDFDPDIAETNVLAPQKHRSLTANPLKEGEIVILKDYSSPQVELMQWCSNALVHE